MIWQIKHGFYNKGVITIDILDRSYAKKLFKGVSSGYKSSTVTVNADGS